MTRGGRASDYPATLAQIYDDWASRRQGLLHALTDEMDEFYKQCDPDRENLCLYGEPSGDWTVDLPAEEVPSELPEPCLGINFARDGMEQKDWLRLVAAHSDAWLMSVAFYYGAKLKHEDRMHLFKEMNEHNTLFEIVSDRYARSSMTVKRERQDVMKAEPDFKQEGPGPMQSAPMAEAKSARQPLGTGRKLTIADVNQNLRGRQAELFWPDDELWYLIEIQNINPKTRVATIKYTSGEEENLKLDEIIRDGHMSLIVS